MLNVQNVQPWHGLPSATHGTRAVSGFSFRILYFKQCAFDCHDGAIMYEAFLGLGQASDLESN